MKQSNQVIDLRPYLAAQQTVEAPPVVSAPVRERKESRVAAAIGMVECAVTVAIGAGFGIALLAFLAALLR